MFNTKYGRNLKEAVLNADGATDTLTYFSVFLEAEDNQYNKAYEAIFDGKRNPLLLHFCLFLIVFLALQFIPTIDSKTWVKNTPLRRLLPYNIDEFWRYSGSVPNPGQVPPMPLLVNCAEIATWTVFKVGRYINSMSREKTIFIFFRSP